MKNNIDISNILYNWRNAEDINTIDNLLLEIVSAFRAMQDNNNLYNLNTCKQLRYIKNKLYVKRRAITHARKERIAKSTIVDNNNIVKQN